MKQYNAVASIFAKDMGPVFSRPIKRIIEAENPQVAVNIAMKEFNEYCGLLNSEHGKEFTYNELDVQEIEENEE